MELDLSKEALPIYEALASQTRLSMLRYIGNEKKSISEIAQALQISNAITTRHVQQMEDAGLLDSERGTGTNRNKK
ncbi:helix-turn-helix domain-containing protein, partial [Enterococcus faecalis]|nr:helix-turn-helix domain-containing protein [Enterococcus faecalis]